MLGHIQQLTSDKVHEQSWENWDSRVLRYIIETMKGIVNEMYVLPDERRQLKNTIQQLRHEALGESKQS